MLHEGVVLLGSTLCQRLEPMRIVRYVHLLSPLLHACSHGVGYSSVQPCPVVHHVNHLVVDILRQIFVHLLAVEHVFTKELRRTFLGRFHFDWTLLERLFYYLKS